MDMKDVVSGVLKEAVDYNIIPANPAFSLKKILKRKHKRRTMDELRESSFE